MQNSYSCTTKLERLNKSHKQKILMKSNEIQNKFNSADGSKCHLKKGSFRIGIFYKATVNCDL